MLKYLDGSPEESDPTGEIESANETSVTDDSWLAEIDEELAQVEEQETPNLEPAVSPETEENQAAAFKQKITGLEQRIGYLERIVKISQILNSTLSLKPLLQIIVQAATELTGTEQCSIMLMDRNSHELRFAEATGGVSEALKKVPVPLEGSIGGWVVRSNRPLLIRDVKNDPRWHRGVDETIDFETRSILGVPLKVRDKVIGVLEVVNKVGEGGFVQDDIQIAETLGAQAAIAIENARLMDELQQAYRDLSEVDRIKGDFVSIASHELRTPLSLILGYASFLRDNVTGQASEQADIVLSSAIKLRSIIDDMVNLRHVQAGSVQLERSMFSLRELVLEVIKEFSDFVKAKQQKLTSRFIPNDTPLNIDADRPKVHLILANLVSNASKFTGEGGRIHLDVELKGHEYWISVIDTGVGIPESQYHRIFDQFYQVEPSLTRKFEGMGLGLSIAKGMVEVHRGRIWVESVEGKGSKFTVVFPTAPDVAT
ncbi:MAG: GAF domain-containing sensor histidine kinase [Anaerolineae bacterium]|nr:GAF domain-containing sensor histidine kinase [Anaerolineae bacterium]